MLANLGVCVMTGLGFAAYASLGLGAGFWTSSLWYVLGCWVGLAVSVGVFVAIGPDEADHRGDGRTRWRRADR